MAGMLKKMMKRVSVTALLLFFALVPVTPVYAADSAASNESCDIIDTVKPGTKCGEGEAKSTLGSLVGGAVRTLSFAVGVAAILMVIYGGLKYVTSGGDATKTKNARATVMYSLIGLAVAVLAQVIVNILINTAP